MKDLKNTLSATWSSQSLENII